MLLLALAVPIGTRVASSLLKRKALLIAPSKRSMSWGYTAMLSLLLITVFLHTRLLISLHHKSQLLKANYNIDWSSIDYQLPSFSEFSNGKSFSHLSFYVEIENSTEYQIRIEESELYVEKNQINMAVIEISGFELSPQEIRRIKIQLDSNSDLSQLGTLNNLLDGWRIDMSLQVWPGIPLIVNLLETERDEQN